MSVAGALGCKCGAQESGPGASSAATGQEALGVAREHVADRAAASVTSPAAAPPTPLRRYGVESGVIEYRLSGERVGKETVQWKHFGQRERRDTRTSSGNMPKRLVGSVPELHTVTLIEGNGLTRFDSSRKSGTRVQQPVEALGEQELVRGLRFLGAAELARLGAKALGPGRVAGVDCERWSVPRLSAELCLHEGLTLESEFAPPSESKGGLPRGAEAHSVAIEIQLGAAVDDSAFDPPGDVSIRELDASALGELERAGLVEKVGAPPALRGSGKQP